ncbi:NADH dehydrogenase [ubiquinone] 1 beta subcomplex subunit 7 [Ambystoma mexicanum]|uniref:NADH dehydrogenase [ubiquinone] 1 beta subcomplex subunit 7 n=1 Tax=Ambystoma mexicanum TaxID=8296 RepID=UPI0037E8DB7F
MGAHLARRYLGDPEPDPLNLPTFSPELGFPEERKERVMIATQEEMNTAQLPLELRDYCAHHLMKLLKCKRDSWPKILACKHERHDWNYCEHQDFVMRMKEYERERRLLARKKRLEDKHTAEAHGM